MMGPAILVTVGVLQLLDEATRWGWDRSWPMLLIVIGAVLVLRKTASAEGHVPYEQRVVGDERLQRKIDRFQAKADKFQSKKEQFDQRINDLRSEPYSDAGPSGPAEGEAHNG